MTTFKNLFSPISINTMSLPNRIVMTAMHLGYTPDGEVTDRFIDFYIERAKGGVGLIIVGGCPIDEYGGMSSMVSFVTTVHARTQTADGSGKAKRIQNRGPASTRPADTPIHP